MPNLISDPGPYETEDQARTTPAVQAVYTAYRAGTASLHDGSADLLLSACEAAGVTLGAYDLRILNWLAGFEPHSAAAVAVAVAGIIIRAAARPPHEIVFNLAVGDCTYFCLSESLGEWGARQREQAISEGGNADRERWSDRAAEMLSAAEAAFAGHTR